MRFDDFMQITESFDRPTMWSKISERVYPEIIEQKYRFDVANKQFIVRFGIMLEPQLDVSVDFERGDISGGIDAKTKLTNDVGGKDAIKVMATVMDIVKKNAYVHENGSFVFELKLSESSRAKLYQRMIRRFGKSSTIERQNDSFALIRVYV